MSSRSSSGSLATDSEDSSGSLSESLSSVSSVRRRVRRNSVTSLAETRPTDENLQERIHRLRGQLKVFKKHCEQMLVKKGREDGFAREYMEIVAIERADRDRNELVKVTKAIVVKNRYMDIVPVSETAVALNLSQSRGETPIMHTRNFLEPSAAAALSTSYKSKAKEKNKDKGKGKGKGKGKDKSALDSILGRRKNDNVIYFKRPPSKDETVAEQCYINANYVELNGEMYVCAQGPLKNTTSDFWRMVWQEGGNVVVMLTNIIENGIDKCCQYWPVNADHPVDTGQLLIVLEEAVRDNHHIVVKRLRLTRKRGGEERVIHHVHFTGWPDQGVCTSAEMGALIAEVDRWNRDGQPLVVHCSAGVGRTGVFVATHSCIHTAMKYINDSQLPGPDFEFFNLKNTVVTMRQQRPFMVQNREQYLLAHGSVYDKVEHFLADKEAEEFNTAAEGSSSSL